MMKLQQIMKHALTSGKVLMLGALLGASSTAFAQTENTLKGRVVNSKGEPIVGAVVNVAEESRIALTDKDGYFTLKKVSNDDEICVSSLGYKNAQEKVTTFDGTFSVTLEDDLDEYEHMAPVPFSEVKKKLVTDARSTVGGTELQRYPVTILQNAFTSTLNGVETYEWSSEPGWSETAMYIRGIRTMNSSARAPLVIVDNVERDLSFLDAFPIESVTVLKDAAATALYGMRGANGVIMVTTKRGEAGRTKIDFTQEIGFNTLSNTMETQNSYNMALTRNQVRYLSGMDPMYTDEQIANYKYVSEGGKFADDDIRKYQYFNTNWFDELYRDAAPQYRTNLQISGGNARARYYVSFSYLRQEGMWNSKGTKYNKDFDTNHVLNRWNLRSNIDIDVSKYLNVSLDLGGRIDNIKQPTTGVFSLVTFGAVEANPMEPTNNPDGTLYSSSTANNPTRLLGASGQEKNRRRNLYSTLNVKYDLSPILPGLGLFGTLSFDAYETFQSTQTNNVNSWNYDYDNYDVTDPSEFTYTRYTTASALSNPSANQRTYYYNLNMYGGVSYQHTFGGKHAVDARAFIRAYKNEEAGSDYSAAQSQSSNRYLSYNFSGSYAYNNRYVAAFNLSRMGCDNYAEGDRYDTFWSASAAWVASEESFLKQLGFVDLAKIRLSYGRTGQSSTGAGRYPYQSTFGSSTGYGFGYNATWVSGYAETLAGNYNNKWEISKMLNVGLDWDLWHKKLYGTLDIFKEWRSNILVTRSTIPQGVLGISVAQDSYGKVESHGFELNIGHRNKIGDFSYLLETNWSYNTNKITEMDETEPDVEWQRKTGKRIYDNTSVAALYEGGFNNTVGGWYVYKFKQWASDANLIASSEEDAIAHPEKYPYNTYSNGSQALGTAVFEDINGDRVIDSKDMVADSYTIIPEITGNITLGVAWKGFDARAVLTAYLNRSVFLSPAISWSGWSNMGTHEVTKAWGYYTDDPTDERNINAKYPRPVYGGFDDIDSNRDTGTYQNTIWVQNGNYWSLRNIEVGYSLPKRLIAKVSMTKCRFYFSAYNICNWSHMPDGIDPEKPMSYCWWYPKTRTYTFGVNIGF
jgi:TonB-linked SusC/RagA family outer membrane protein